jgi:hypothetical protein
MRWKTCRASVHYVVDDAVSDVCQALPLAAVIQHRTPAPLELGAVHVRKCHRPLGLSRQMRS